MCVVEICYCLATYENKNSKSNIHFHNLGVQHKSKWGSVASQKKSHCWTVIFFPKIDKEGHLF